MNSRSNKKRVDRPWHNNAASNILKKLAAEAEACQDYVEVAGVKFYSDRFYLNETIFDADLVSNGMRNTDCHCGTSSPPPLFSRTKLVNSLQVKAAILGTYTFDLNALQHDFPALFGADATIPTLVMHGRKGWSLENLEQKQQQNEESQSTSSCCQSPGGFLSDDNTVATQEEATLQACCSNQESSPTKMWSEEKNPFPETVHFSEITPNWLPSQDLPSKFARVVDSSTGFLRQEILDKRCYKQGVHHPKFMLLFEESGSVVVVVSTANLTTRLSQDGTWLKRFPALQEANTKKSNNSNDFGAVLANFLQCQTLATAENQLTVQGFVQRYLNWKSVLDLERNFDFGKAEVQLVATVPGEYGGRVQGSRNDGSNDTKRVLYGQQRIAHLVDRLNLPSMFLTDQDRLVFQPTSFGGEWNLRNMAGLVRSYMGQDSDLSDHDLVSKLDIFWPTDHFIREASQIVKGRKSPDAVADFGNIGFSSDPIDNNNDKEVDIEQRNGGFLFLSSEIFNKIDLSCLSRMVMFEPSVPAQQSLALTPHFKSVARLFTGNDYRIRKDFGFPKCREYFPWFILTSACLSRGAQGEPLSNNGNPGNDAVSYSNFELGVMFTSRLQRSHKDRLYCFQPLQCSCASPTSRRGRLIHLPSPYCFRPASYAENEDEAEFCETPFFHEIPRGTGCVGNMLMTPYGRALAAQQARADARI